MRNTTFPSLVLLLVATSAARAQDCVVVADVDTWWISDADASALYDCIEPDLARGYAQKGDPIATAYRSWSPAATRPAVSGPHDERFLMTFANDIAAERYLKFEIAGITMPKGSVLATESFDIDPKTHVLRSGPLYTMTKIGIEEAPDTMGWLYGLVSPDGTPVTPRQKDCNDCHATWEARDGMVYPQKGLRLGRE